MTTPRLDTDVTPPTVSITDELSFQTAADIRASLLDAFERVSANMRVDVSEVGSFDLAGVQLLYAAARTAEERGIALTVEYGENAERFEKFYRFAGLTPLGGGPRS
ncbi:MAG: lipid asymmetry maintenance protein MlaB [Spirochaetaceae bacterium]